MKNTMPNIFQRLALRVLNSGTWRPQTVADLDKWMDATSGGYSASSGAVVSGDTAVNFAAFFSGVFQICQTIASCRTQIFKETGDFTKNPWKNHPVYSVLTGKTNAFMNSFTWKERMQYHAMVWGNGYSFIQRDFSRRIIGLWPLNPERITPRIDTESLESPAMYYDYADATGAKITYPQADIFHIAGFGFDSVKGYSLLEIARETIGLGLSQQEFTGRFLANGAHLGGILTSKKELKQDGRERLKAQFSTFHSGVGNAGRFAVLEEDMDYKPLGMPLADAQFLESKVFQIGEIARILNISPYKLKDYSHATFSNIEHLGIEYATDTIRPWAERWEASINTQLLSPSEQSKGFAEFDLGSIQRGDSKSQNEAFNVARNGGWMNADEIRYHQGMNPISDETVGKMYWRPKNMADASKPDADGYAARQIDDNKAAEGNDDGTE